MRAASPVLHRRDLVSRKVRRLPCPAGGWIACLAKVMRPPARARVRRRVAAAMAALNKMEVQAAAAARRKESNTATVARLAKRHARATKLMANKAWPLRQARTERGQGRTRRTVLAIAMKAVRAATVTIATGPTGMGGARCVVSRSATVVGWSAAGQQAVLEEATAGERGGVHVSAVGETVAHLGRRNRAAIGAPLPHRCRSSGHSPLAFCSLLSLASSISFAFPQSISPSLQGRTRRP